MARKTKNPAKKKADPRERQPFYSDPEADWGGFVNIRLSDEHKSLFQEWWENNPDTPAIVLDELLAAGMKISFAYDMDNECYICSLLGSLVSESDSRFVMTTRAGRFEDVIALAVWKHVVLAKGDYGDFRPKDGTFMNWG